MLKKPCVLQEGVTKEEYSVLRRGWAYHLGGAVTAVRNLGRFQPGACLDLQLQTGEATTSGFGGELTQHDRRSPGPRVAEPHQAQLPQGRPSDQKEAASCKLQTDPTHRPPSCVSKKHACMQKRGAPPPPPPAAGLPAFPGAFPADRRRRRWVLTGEQFVRWWAGRRRWNPAWTAGLRLLHLRDRRHCFGRLPYRACLVPVSPADAVPSLSPRGRTGDIPDKTGHGVAWRVAWHNGGGAARPGAWCVCECVCVCGVDGMAHRGTSRSSPAGSWAVCSSFPDWLPGGVGERWDGGWLGPTCRPELIPAALLWSAAPTTLEARAGGPNFVFLRRPLHDWTAAASPRVQTCSCIGREPVN